TVEKERAMFGHGTPVVEKTPGPREKNRVSWKEELVWYELVVPSAVHQLRMQVGRVYLIDVESTQFWAVLHLKNASGRVVATNWRFNTLKPLNSCLIFTPNEDGIYGIVVGSFYCSDRSFRRVEWGDYRLTIHAIARSGPPHEWWTPS